MTARRKSSELFFIAGILLVAINLRPALSSVGPLVDFIRSDLRLTSAQVGLLTTLPLFAFGVVSVFTPVFTKQFGVGKTLLGAMALLTVGIGLRSLWGVFGLYSGTVLLGIAIAFGNVIIPIITKEHFSDNAGFITGLYSCCMSLGPAVAAGVSVPLAVGFNLGWRGSLSVWALLSFLAFWRFQVHHLTNPKRSRSFAKALKDLSGIPLVWKMAIFMGLQSFAFYVILTWLPMILIDAGYTPGFSGWMLSLSQATGIIGTIVMPIWAGKRKDQRLVVLTLLFLELLSLIGLLFPKSGLLVLWVSLIGFAHGGTFGLALLLIVLRSSTAEIASELSGIVQSIGYLIASSGPLIVGFVYDLTLNWNNVLLLLMLVIAFKSVTGLEAGKARTI